ncbi:MAG: hypothetical protein WB818_08340, partial [Desulfobacterales bacterium]
MLERIGVPNHRPSHRDFRSIVLAVFTTVICLVTSDCTRHTDVPVTRPDIFWPNPPEVKRIEFVKAISKPEDLNIRPGMLKRVVNYIMGEAEVSMGAPYGIATDSEGRLYVVDTSQRRVHVFDPAGNEYSFFPADKTMLDSPVGIAIDENGMVYITDSKQAAVYVFEDYGKKLVSTIGGDFFKRPTGIVVNPKTSELLVVDTIQSRVFRFDLSTRLPKGSYGTDGATAGQFHYPTN